MRNMIGNWTVVGVLAGASVACQQRADVERMATGALESGG
jgi:hypothetical protein